MRYATYHEWFNSFAADNTPLCDGIFDYVDTITLRIGENMSSIFSSNSEASASELIENHEEMFPRYICKKSWSYLKIVGDLNI